MHRRASSNDSLRRVNLLANAPRHRSGESMRTDLALCARGLASTRAKAQDLIEQGRVLVDGRVVVKASKVVGPNAHLEVTSGRDFVSRGGRKLDRALDELGVDLARKIVVDIGASTGGFTDSALTRGALCVYAVDVGLNQLDAAVASDPRVVVRDRTNARSLSAADFAEPIDVVLVDASFISLGKLAPALFRILRPGGDLVALVKPQFEVGRAAAKQTRGVIRDPKLRDKAIEGARAALIEAGFDVLGECDSRVPGKRGNVERFICARRK
jgi:23S rRNA (cytidine1920-2'-O)/16S rRNA (cytidine1409-2'-O)-methyltransferase